MSSSKPKVCPVCQKGLVKRGIVLLFESDSFYACDSCHSEFHKKDGKYLIKNIPDNSSWKLYEGKLLSFKEIDRISLGGFSDIEIAQRQIEEEERKKAEKDKAERLKKENEDLEKEVKQKLQDTEESKRLSDIEKENEWLIRKETPGTPENYLMRFRKIFDVEDSGSNFELMVQAKNKDEVRQYLKHFGQLQKELKQLKKDINSTRKQINRDYEERKIKIYTEAASYGSSRSVTTLRTLQIQPLLKERNLEIQSYDEIIKLIDSAILSLDKGKLEIQNQSMGLEIENSSAKKKKTKPSKSADDSTEKLNVEDVLQDLNALIGLDNVKAEIQELTDFLKIQQVRKSRNLPTPSLSLHVVFYGNPGTGKTTVARLLAKIYKAMGVLSKGQLIETDRSGLVAGYVGQTAIKVTEMIEQSLGGILFIDEAYSLTDNDKGDYGSEAIDTLIKAMEDHRDDLAVVIAGYTGKMERFLSSNPGLKSRFNRFWNFKDYIPQELFKIFLSLCSTGHYKLSNLAMRKLAVLLQKLYEQKDETFGNGRLVRNIYEEAISNQASRLVSVNDLSDDNLRTIEAEDIPKDISSLRLT